MWWKKMSTFSWKILNWKLRDKKKMGLSLSVSGFISKTPLHFPLYLFIRWSFLLFLLFPLLVCTYIYSIKGLTFCAISVIIFLYKAYPILIVLDFYGVLLFSYWWSICNSLYFGVDYGWVREKANFRDFFGRFSFDCIVFIRSNALVFIFIFVFKI